MHARYTHGHHAYRAAFCAHTTVRFQWYSGTTDTPPRLAHPRVYSVASDFSVRFARTIADIAGFEAVHFDFFFHAEDGFFEGEFYTDLDVASGAGAAPG